MGQVTLDQMTLDQVGGSKRVIAIF